MLFINFKTNFTRPSSQGTRCQQLAMFTMFYAPLEMLADSPTDYEKEPNILNYLSQMPTVWDQTIPLDGKIGDFAVIARKSKNNWHVAGMTDWTARKVKVVFDFIDSGNYNAELFTDGVNANRIGSDYKRKIFTVKKGDEIEIEMAPGGGFAIKLTK